MDYFFIEYRSNDMVPGDWGWYVDSYSVDPKTGKRAWINNNEFVVQAYKFPEGLNDHVLTGVAFTPMTAKAHSKQVSRVPATVRWGMATCLRKDFAELLGPGLSENAVVGQLRLEDGKIVKNWVPVIFKNHISIPIGKPDDAPATAKYLDGKAIYESDKYLIILREDVYQIVRGFHFEGCKVTRGQQTGRVAEIDIAS